MNVPFSMSDEPDLGDEFRWVPDDDRTPRYSQSPPHRNPMHSTPPAPPPMRRGDGGFEPLQRGTGRKESFSLGPRTYTQSEMDDVIRASIRAQDVLRNEIIDMMNEMYQLKQQIRSLVE